MENKQMTDIEKNWGYVAGFLDADGSLTLMKRLNRNKRTSRLEPRITFHNSCKPALEQIQKIIGCGWVSLDKRKHKYRKKCMYTLTVTNFKDISRILCHCLPYLVVKKDRARLLLNFCRIRLAKADLTHKHPWNTTSYGEEELNIFKEMKRLNKRMPDGKLVVTSGVAPHLILLENEKLQKKSEVELNE